MIPHLADEKTEASASGLVRAQNVDSADHSSLPFPLTVITVSRPQPWDPRAPPSLFTFLSICKSRRLQSGPAELPELCSVQPSQLTTAAPKNGSLLSLALWLLLPVAASSSLWLQVFLSFLSIPWPFPGPRWSSQRTCNLTLPHCPGWLLADWTEWSPGLDGGIPACDLDK